MQRAFEKIIKKFEGKKAELEEITAQCRATQEVCNINHGYVVAMSYAIEIVNQVASEVAEEVCEWKEDMTLSRSAIGHGKFESLMYVCKWKYCPYCGKKIKVVEPYEAESEG